MPTVGGVRDGSDKRTQAIRRASHRRRQQQKPNGQAQAAGRDAIDLWVREADAGRWKADAIAGYEAIKGDVGELTGMPKTRTFSSDILAIVDEKPVKRRESHARRN